MTEDEINALIFTRDTPTNKLVGLRDVFTDEEIYDLPSHPAWDQFSRGLQDWVFMAIDAMLHGDDNPTSADVLQKQRVESAREAARPRSLKEQRREATARHMGGIISQSRQQSARQRQQRLDTGAETFQLVSPERQERAVRTPAHRPVSESQSSFDIDTRPRFRR